MLSFCAALRTLKLINSTKKEYQSFGLSNESFESVVVAGLEVQGRINTCVLFNSIYSFMTH